MNFFKKKLNELTQEELLEIFKERMEVFIVEQQCSYQDIDDDDKTAQHLFLKDNNNIIAYTRIIDKKDYVKFGRVLVKKEYRKKNLGRKLINETITEIKKEFPNKDITIQAQHYLLNFYKSFGFKEISDVYLEDDIPHIDMILKTTNN